MGLSHGMQFPRARRSPSIVIVDVFWHFTAYKIEIASDDWLWRRFVELASLDSYLGFVGRDRVRDS